MRTGPRCERNLSFRSLFDTGHIYNVLLQYVNKCASNLFKQRPINKTTLLTNQPTNQLIFERINHLYGDLSIPLQTLFAGYKDADKAGTKYSYQVTVKFTCKEEKTSSKTLTDHCSLLIDVGPLSIDVYRTTFVSSSQGKLPFFVH